MAHGPLEEHLTILSATSDKLVIQAEATGLRSTLLIAGLILGIFGIVALVGVLLPVIRGAGLRVHFGTVGGLLLICALVAAGIGYYSFSAPVVTLRRGSDRVDVKRGRHSETIQLDTPAFGTSRFITKPGLPMMSLHVNLRPDRSLTLASLESERSNKLHEIVDALNAFVGRPTDKQ